MHPLLFEAPQNAVLASMLGDDTLGTTQSCVFLQTIDTSTPSSTCLSELGLLARTPPCISQSFLGQLFQMRLLHLAAWPTIRLFCMPLLFWEKVDQIDRGPRLLTIQSFSYRLRVDCS